MGNDDILASDAEREQCIARLRDACGEGRLSLEEFAERVNRVFAARTRGELAPVIADLPATATPVAAPRTAPRITLSILSDVKRRGPWQVDRETTALSILGSCTLDLRRAQTRGSEIVVNAHALLGSVKIIVPCDTVVELDGFSLLGSRESRVPDADALPGVPTVRVRGLTIMGSVEVVADASSRRWW